MFKCFNIHLQENPRFHNVQYILSSNNSMNQAKSLHVKGKYKNLHKKTASKTDMIMKDIITWAWEYFGEALLIDNVHCCTYKCKAIPILYISKHPEMLPMSLCPSSSEMKVCCGLTSPNFS